LGQDEKLWLKARAETIQVFESAACERFSYLVKGKARKHGLLTRSREAMESANVMAPWACMALQAALTAHPANSRRPKKASYLKQLPINWRFQ